MRDIQAWLVLLALLCVLPAAPCPAAETVNARSLSRASMVIVSSHIGEGRDAIGAGVVVALQPHRLRVVTARHVADRGPVTVWVDGRAWPAEIVRTFADRDLAVVDAAGAHLDRLPVRPALMAQATASGSDVYVWGENETGFRIKHASVVSAAFIPPGRIAVSAAALLSIACDACAPGDSGGGIFDTDGRLLAILTTRYYTPDNRTFAIVGEHIDESIYTLDDGPFEL